MSIAKRILALKQKGKSVKDYDRWFELVRSWPAGPSEGTPPLPQGEGDEQLQQRDLPLAGPQED